MSDLPENEKTIFDAPEELIGEVRLKARRRAKLLELEIEIQQHSARCLALIEEIKAIDREK